MRYDNILFSKMDRCYGRGASDNSNHTVVYRNMAMDKFRPRMDVKKVIMSSDDNIETDCRR